MVDPEMVDWDSQLNEMIAAVKLGGDFVEFTLTDIRGELQNMKCKSAVGPDGIGVHLLRCMASHDDLGPQLLSLTNHIVRTQSIPSSWNTSFLALLAKIEFPTKPGDLRPISVSSAFNKLVNRLVCARALPFLRRGSRVSACGKGRQAADLIGTVSRVRDVVHEWRAPALICKLDVAGAFDRVDRRKVANLLVQRLKNPDINSELCYLLSQLRVHELVGKVPGGGQIHVRPNNGIKQGAPESAEIFGLVVDAILGDLTAARQWQAFGESLPGLDVDVMFFQDDIFVLEQDLCKLGRRVRVLDKGLRQAGLRLATEKTKIIASAAYHGHRKIRIGDDIFQISSQSDSIKVLGVSFSFGMNPSQQAQEMLARARAAAASHRDILSACGPWSKKLYMIKMLVESRFAWTAGALHWSSEDLRCANLLQLHTLRSAFGLKRKRDETWVDWNSRTMRFLRAWLVSHGHSRWSEKILGLQFSLHGHWARRVEFNQDRDEVSASLPMRSLLWKSTLWWRGQQALSPSVGARHPARFFASNPERQLSESLGNRWHVIAQDRLRWAGERVKYIRMWDVKWSAMENPFRLSVFMMACLPWLALLLLTTCWRCSLATSDDEWEDSWGTSWSSPANVETSSSSPGPSSSISSWMAAPASSWDDPSWMAAPASSWDDPSWPASSTSSSMPSSSSWSHAEFVDWMSAAWDEEISLAAQLQIWHGEAAVQRDESGVDFVGTTNAAPEPDDLPLPFSPSMAPTAWLCPDCGTIHVVLYSVALNVLVFFVQALPFAVLELFAWGDVFGYEFRLFCADIELFAGILISWGDLFSGLRRGSWECLELPAEGITQRLGVQRPARDRWHNLDGTIKRNTLQTVPEEDPAINEAPSQVVAACCSEETTVTAVSFYGETVQVHASPGASLSMDEETSTTAGDDEGRDDRDEATSSSDASTTPVTPGFWHHGVWVNRPRTPAEHRRHVGGGGLKRLLKREARMNSYFKGDWKPRWLCDYIDQKAKREQVLAADDDKNEQPGEADDESTEVASNPWAELGWWTQDEWQQWWSWNGLQNGTSSSSPSAWQSSSTTWPSSSTSTSTTSWATSWTTSSSSGVSSLSLSPSWLYLESSYLWWGDLAWLFALVGEVESTTSTTSSSSLPPNHGLLPLVGPAQPIVKMQMELTGAETAVLQEAAVPQQTLARLQSMMEMLDRHQAEGRGPEARWALGCLLRRLDEGT
eukprot:s2481_g4.t2